MQAELDASYPNLPIQILAVNGIGYSSGIASLSSIHTLPMVEDTNTDLIWSQWGAVYRDVMILDGNNELVDAFNLTSSSLNSSSNYNALMQLFIDTANGL
ncbi:MAG: hypothetical protein VXZ96_07980 [Myxococcota bacterium]|nr:hypothetical protein [Myxococcota bacterium]